MKFTTVNKYTQNHPKVNRDAVIKYASNNPQVNQVATTKYNEKRSRIRLLPWANKRLSGFKYDSQIDYSRNRIVDLGSRLPCAWCRVQKWLDEIPGMYCNGGKIQLPTLEPYPPIHQHSMAESFLFAARKYSGCFQMTSFRVKEVK